MAFNTAQFPNYNLPMQNQFQSEANQDLSGNVQDSSSNNRNSLADRVITHLNPLKILVGIAKLLLASAVSIIALPIILALASIFITLAILTLPFLLIFSTIEVITRLALMPFVILIHAIGAAIRFAID